MLPFVYMQMQQIHVQNLKWVFELTDYDKRVLKFSNEYSKEILAIDVNLEIDQMLNKTWDLFQEFMTKDEVGIKQEFVDLYWKN